VPDIRVRIRDQEYPIRIQAGALDDLGEFLLEVGRPTRIVVVSDETVATLYEDRALRSLSRSGLEADGVRVAPGEASKSLDVAASLYTALLERRIDRKSIVIALGGGVVGDLAGFVAATILRGIDYVQVPTTLLAQVDSSVGGKTAVDHPLGKNLIGAFHQPRGVLTDPTTLTTLPRPEFVAGLAEVVKTAMIRDAEFLTFLEGHTRELAALDADALTRAITRCCEIKADVVAADPCETTGVRAILNYGHTIGHALEAITDFSTYRHGEAVAVGMVAAALIAAARGLIDEALVRRQSALLEALGLPTSADELRDDRLIAALSRDKKVEGGRWRFILPTGPGRVAIFDDVTESDVRQALAGC